MSIEESASILREARNVEDIHAAAKLCAHAYDFDKYTITSAIPDINGRLAFASEVSLPDEYKSEFLEWHRNNEGKTDPVMEALKGSVPVAWDSSTYAAVGMGAHWESIAGFGMVQGVAMGIHLRNGHHLLVGFDTSVRRQPNNGERMAQMLALQTFTANLVSVAHEIVFPAALATLATTPPGAYVVKDPQYVMERPGLTPRECEVLSWASTGKTSWEVSVIVQISERTVEKHISSAMAKLNCRTRAHAVARALQLGLIT